MKRNLAVCLLTMLTLLLARWPGEVRGSQESFSITMPIATSDIGSEAYGIWPFGAHGGSHSADGHPGWDIEYRIGASALVAADGVVQSVFTDSQASDRVTVQIEHRFNDRTYRTVYTNIATLADGIAPGLAVTAGQGVGIPATFSAMIGQKRVTYAMIHFQFDDFRHNSGITNVHAVSPEKYLDARGREIFNAVWSAASYSQELCEPFPSNPRDVVFPLTRRWTLESGSMAQRVDFTRQTADGSDYQYAMFDQQGAITERGTARINATAQPLPTIDFLAEDGPPRLGVYNVVGDRMQIDCGLPGDNRPSNLAGASVYRTSPTEGEDTPPAVSDVVVGEGAAKIKRGRTVSIQWSVADAVSQMIELSTDGGETFMVITELGGRERIYAWSVSRSLPQTKRAVVRVQSRNASGKTGQAVSDTFKLK
jgi:hypothetical protein